MAEGGGYFWNQIRHRGGEASENPLQVSYWFGKVDPRPLALFRILFGLGLCHDLFNYSQDLGVFATDLGMLPRGTQGDPRAWSLFNFFGNSASVTALFAVGCCIIVSYTLGYKTRLSSALGWLFLTSLHTRNLYVTDGGDDLARNLLFLSIFGDLSGCWSIDTHLGKKARFVTALALRFLQLHIVLLYFVAARLKFRAGWLTRNIIYQCLQLTGFLRPPGLLLLKSPLFCRASTLMTLGMEWAFPFLALSPWRVAWSRGLAIAAGGGVQLAILLTMRVGLFTETMLASMALFMRPEWFDWLGRKLKLNLSVGALPPPEESELLGTGSIPQLAAFAFLSFNFLTLAWGPFAARRFPPPAWVLAEKRWLWLDQPMGLFDVVYDIPSWRATGVTVDGKQVDVLPSAIPDLPPVVRWRFSRWYKFTFKERERAYRFPALGAFVCRSYATATGERLKEFSFYEDLTPARVPGGQQNATRSRERWHQVCAQP